MKYIKPKYFAPKVVRKGASSARKGATGAVKEIKEKVTKGWEPYPEDEGKAGEIVFGCHDARPKTCPYILRLERDLVNSYYWSGDFCKDYLFFVSNWHPVLSIVCCHPNHPWTKIMRLQMLVISVAISMMPSAVVTAYFYGSEWDEAMRFLTILCFVTIPDVVYGVVMYQLAIGKTRRCGQFLRGCWVAAQYCCFVYVVIFVAFSMGICYLILHAVELTLGPMVRPILQGRLISAAIWFPIWLFLPCQLGYLSLWYAEQRAAEKTAKKESGDIEDADGDVEDAPNDRV